MVSKIKHFLGLIYWFIFRPKTFGVKCVVENDGEVLMIKNSYGGYKQWMFPGGGINNNETPDQAIKRELLEEVGIAVENLRKIGEYTSNQEFKKDTVIVFTGITQNKELNIDTREILEAKWFSIDHLPEISEYSKLIISMACNKKPS
ncbi:MAG: NUDIX hydrolase [Parcubacteria group bacterium Gr01-1014_3]|nr:MAG: NUDIX hydrolase [Parcubacteria group bacterium Gr01-1014_3]